MNNYTSDTAYYKRTQRDWGQLVACKVGCFAQQVPWH